MFEKLGNEREQTLQPEELVRLNLLRKMVDQLNYPKSLLAKEVELSSLPHLRDKKEFLPKRRADIICFAKGVSLSYELFPLLVIECKSLVLTSQALEQVKGYNFYLNAPFWAIANSEEIRTFWYNESQKRDESVNFLPSYDQLIKAVKK
jgi:hypothetical protein